VTVLGLRGIRKESDQKMKYLATVRAGSRGDLHQGCRLCDVTAVEVDGSEIISSNQKLFSVAAKQFASEDAEVLAAMDPGVHPGLSWRAEKFRGNSCESEVLTVLLGALCRVTHVSSFSLDRRTTQYASSALVFAVCLPRSLEFVCRRSLV
jgi:hypothetical protein